MLQSDPYAQISLLSAVIVFTMGICLFTVAMPTEPQFRNYRLSRRLLGVAYIFLSGVHFAGIFIDSAIHVDTIVAPFQALMFTFALIALIDNRFVTRKRLAIQLAIIFALSALVLVNRYVLPRPIVWVAYLIHAIYAGLYIHYVWIFFREYRNYKRRADGFFSGDEYKRLRWIVRVFVMAAVIGIFGGVLKENNIYFLIFIVGYTVLYSYMAIRYINYVGLFYGMAPIVSETRYEDSVRKSKTTNALETPTRSTGRK